MIFSQFSGNIILTNYAASLFKESGSQLDPHTSAIGMMSIQVFGAYIASVFVDKIGRRSLLMLSTMGTAIGMCSMATFNYLIHHGYDMTEFNWIPVTSLSVSVFMSNIGLIPLVFVIMAEVLPMKVSML